MTDYETVLKRSSTRSEIVVEEYTNGLIGPDVEWEGPVESGGTITAETAPGCWGPMITPSFRGPHEVTRPTAVEGATVGDAIVIRIRSIEVQSIATSTGTHEVREGAFVSDPGVDHQCPECGTPWPETVIEGTGEDAVRCANCGANASSYAFGYGYTMVFDEDNTVGMTVGEEAATALAEDAHEAMALPEHAEQHPILLYRPSNVPGSLSRLSPFVGHIGTTPPVTIPDSRNAGDLGQRLIGAEHDYGLPADGDFAERTDAHMDINEVREGAVLIAPVKLAGGGVYLGDVHANQGDGELAMHTTDVSAAVDLEVSVVEDVDLDGPIVLPREEDLPEIAKPFTETELARGRDLARQYGEDLVEDVAPLQIVGTGETVNAATENAFDRAGDLLGMSRGEVRTRSTFSGGVSVGRLPGVVQLSLLAPMERIEAVGLGEVVAAQYDL